MRSYHPYLYLLKETFLCLKPSEPQHPPQILKYRFILHQVFVQMITKGLKVYLVTGGAGFIVSLVILPYLSIANYTIYRRAHTSPNLYTLWALMYLWLISAPNQIQSWTVTQLTTFAVTCETPSSATVSSKTFTPSFIWLLTRTGRTRFTKITSPLRTRITAIWRSTF